MVPRRLSPRTIFLAHRLFRPYLMPRLLSARSFMDDVALLEQLNNPLDAFVYVKLMRR